MKTPQKIYTFQTTEDTSLRKLNISIKTNISENGDHLLKKWKKNPSKLAFLQDFRFYQWSAHNKKKIILLKQIVIAFRIDN